MPHHPELIWYVSYGSNMSAARLDCYLSGGRPPGALRDYPGCRDRTPPRASAGCVLDGGVYFATWSHVWQGGRAFYDAALPGSAPARAYLISAAQFADIAAQEMYRDPDGDLDLGPVLDHGRAECGLGRYETLLHLGSRDGHPMLTFTAPWQAGDVPWVTPSAAYLRMLGDGLREAHTWNPQRIAGHLAALPGAQGRWTPAAVAAALAAAPSLGAPTAPPR